MALIQPYSTMLMLTRCYLADNILLRWPISLADTDYLSIIFRRPPGNHKPISPVCSHPSSSITSLLPILKVIRSINHVWKFENKSQSTKQIRLSFIFVIALENNWTSHTDFTTRMGLVFSRVIHLWNICKLDFWNRKHKPQGNLGWVLERLVQNRTFAREASAYAWN